MGNAIQKLPIKRHAWAILLALLIGAIYAGPYVFHANTPGYQGVFMADSGDADFYFTAINKSYESRGLIGDPFLYEYQDARNPFQFFLIEFVLGKIGNALRMSMDILAAATAFVFPMLLALLAYAFAYRISGSRLTAIVVSAAVLLGNEVVRFSGVADLFNTFALEGSYREFLAYARPVNPQVSALFFFGALFALYNLLQNPRSRMNIALAGVSVGILLYIYPYFWAFAFVVTGILFLYALIARSRALIFGTFFAGVVSLVIMAPFFIANLPIFLYGSGSALTEAIPTHRVIFEKMILVPLFLYTLIWLYAWKSKGAGKVGQFAAVFVQKYNFVFLLLLAGVVVSNHQVITGKLMFQQHFHFFTNIPMFLFSMSVLGMEVLALVSRLWRIGAASALVILLAWFSIGVQIISYNAHVAEAARHQPLAPIFEYLNTEASPNSVVLTNYFLSTRLTIHTQHFVYMGGYDATFAVPKEQLVHDYFVMLSLRGVKGGGIREYLYEHRNEVGAILFIGTYWRDLCGSYGCFPDQVLEELVPQYQEFIKQPLVQSIRTHKIDYLLWDSVSEPEWQLKGLVRNPPVLESGDFKLYMLQP